ncbi:MAG: serine hydrolase [Bacteroidota bacterium]
MKKYVLTLIVFCLLGGATIIKAQVTPFIAGRLQFTLDSVCAKYKIKGASAAVLIPNVGIWKGTSGVSEAGVPLTSDMLFGMGSNTKTHMAATLLKMQEQQLVSLDDTIGKWITGYPNISGQITIRQCLNHTSGLFDYMKNGAINDSIFGKPSKIWQPEEILGLAMAPNFAPGTSWKYSNTNYIIAGIIIQKVMNKPAFEVMHDLILAPNQLTNTFNYGEEGSRTIAHPWGIDMNGVTLTDMTTTPYLNNLFSLANTAGSLVTTAEENVQFWYKLWSGQIINAQSWKEMTQTKSLGLGDGYGLGVFFDSKKINGRSFYSHGGTFFGFINENMVDTTSGVTIAVLTNQDSVSNSGLKSLVLRSLHKVTLNMPATGIADIHAAENRVAIYPNPVSDQLTIDAGNIKSGTIMISDLMGRTVWNGLVTQQITTINTTEFPNGILLVTCKDESLGVMQTRRIQVAH